MFITLFSPQPHTTRISAAWSEFKEVQLATHSSHLIYLLPNCGETELFMFFSHLCSTDWDHRLPLLGRAWEERRREVTETLMAVVAAAILIQWLKLGKQKSCNVLNCEEFTRAEHLKYSSEKLLLKAGKQEHHEQNQENIVFTGNTPWVCYKLCSLACHHIISALLVFLSFLIFKHCPVIQQKCIYS